MEGQRQRFNDPVKFLPIVFILCNILGLYAIYTSFVLLPAIQDSTTRTYGITLTVIFNILTVLILISYFRCIMVHPGMIPPTDPKWAYNAQDSRRSLESTTELALQETKRSGERRHCKWCAKYKPDRCHHCRVCRVCILRMDHHCPWIYNCVGFGNHKYFFLLLLYSCLACNLITWTMLQNVQESIDSETAFADIFLGLFAETLAAFLGLLITIFFIFHIWLMLRAMTTIEFCEKSRSKAVYEPSLFDRGFLGNIRAVLGDNMLLWLLPVNPPSGDGLSFANTADNKPLMRDIETGRGMRQRRHGKREGRRDKAPRGETESIVSSGTSWEESSSIGTESLYGDKNT